MATTTISNSTYLDATSAGMLPDSTIQSSTIADIQSAFGATGYTALSGDDGSIIMALVLNRAEDASTVLDASWGDRQQALQDPDLWSKYGADPDVFNSVVSTLGSLEGVTVMSGDGYVTSAESRTVWVELNAEGFQNLFGTQLYALTYDGEADKSDVWAGNLSLPSDIAGAVGGVWLEQVASPANITQMGGTATTLEQGAQGTANLNQQVTATPATIADYYNFPLDGSVETVAVGLVEAQISQTDAQQLLEAINQYRTQVLGLDTEITADDLIFDPALTDTSSSAGLNNEYLLDVSVVAGATPNSTIKIYSAPELSSTTFASTQLAVWDSSDSRVSVLSSSHSNANQFTADSPFAWAYNSLMEDATLRNVTLVMSGGDGGSGAEYPNGVSNVYQDHANAHSLVVSGTSLQAVNVALDDPTSSALAASALALDPQTVFDLTAAGLKELPTALVDAETKSLNATLSVLLESVWNAYSLSGSVLDPGYTQNESGGGGVDTTQSTPDYQIAFGLTPTDVSTGETGRGVPDVSALAGGSTHYYVITGVDPLSFGADGGTSAATPLWASLTAQINTIFRDQGLPDLGEYNDLLYKAAAISPAAFNDITLGNNISSYVYATADTPGAIQLADDGGYIVPTGLGYSATTGYDTASGLGTPNGVLLARALTAIAHSELYGTEHDVASDLGEQTATVAHDQTLLVQSTLGEDASVSLDGTDTTIDVSAGSSLAWTARLAQQSLQSDFSDDLVRFLDGASQSTPTTVAVTTGQSVGVSVDSEQTALYQASYTNDAGFLNWGSSDGAVTLARPVAVASTALGQDDTDAIVRVRQNGANDSALTIYRVDDYNGTIDGLSPGDAGYAAAASARAYTTSDGTTAISGPGWGNYAETKITGVDSGDIIAFALTSAGQTYWSFASANETVNGNAVTHLWSYGANTFGFEDIYGGGDQDFNDLIVQLDFTSATGSGWLA